jgi:hypothetical protein
MTTDGMDRAEIHCLRVMIGIVTVAILYFIPLKTLPTPVVGLIYLVVVLCTAYGAGYFLLKGLEALQRWRSKHPKISN